MKNALILHGTDGHSKENWFDWLRIELEKKGYKVWVPDLPKASHPNIKRYNKFLLEENDWEFNEESIIIGHSSGAVSILGLLQALPDNVKVKACYLVGAFKDNSDWDVLDGLFEEPFDFKRIKQKTKAFHFIHSDNDPYCPLDHAKYLCEQVSGELIVLPGQKHFSVDSYGDTYKQFQYLLSLILGNAVDQKYLEQFLKKIEELKIEIWLDGGWAVDALLKKQTRPHADIDIVIQKKDVNTLRGHLENKGYKEVKRDDSSAWNFVIGDDECHMIDFHVIELDKDGNGIYGPKKNGDAFTKEALSGKGKIGDLEVNCISPKILVEYHTGYDLRDKDYHDVKALCEKFNIELPEKYKR
ncbi:MAG: alpha/beta hydrolase [Patescibacteria group bacterium]|nr:alpha/beta hydrolase [Patescibacteria group bacterium]